MEGDYSWLSFPFEVVLNHDESLRIELPVNFRFVDAGPVLKQRMESALQCVRSFYARHGLDLSFGIDLGFAPDPSRAAEISIRNEGMTPRSFNAMNWAFVQDGHRLDDGAACGTFAHELGHLLGLVDEYEDREHSPERWIGEEDSIMRLLTRWPDGLTLYPRHIKEILRGVCPKL